MIAIDGKSQKYCENKPYRLGICLSGGAARGFAHIGVLRAFEEEGIEIDCLSGSSIGALIALFYASGKTADEMLEMTKKIKGKKLRVIKPFYFGKAGLDYVEILIKEHIPQKSIEELDKPIFICVTNFETGKYEIIESGDIIEALRATVAIPIKFGFQYIGGVPYLDGGMVNNLPVEPLIEKCEIVVGISINPIVKKAEKMKLRHKIMRITELIINENEARRISLCDYHLEIEGLGEIQFEDYENAQKIHDLGYKAAKEFIKNNAELKNINK